MILLCLLVDLVINPDDNLVGEADIYLSEVDMEDILLLHSLTDKELSAAIKEDHFTAFLE